MISIVVPTLNESATLPQTIPHTLRAARGAKTEMIVSDCGSRDGTVDVAQRLAPVRVVTGGTCRADALNRGAAAAQGDVLVFLHADSVVPEGFASLIGRALSDSRFVGGAFDWLFSPDPSASRWDRAGLKLVVLCNRVRFRWTHNFYGDQTIFVRRSAFDRIGGFPNVRLMEDLQFSRGMKRLGRVAILRPPVATSPRRFVARGVVRQFLQDLTLLACESCGGRPERLWEHYNDWNHTGK